MNESDQKATILVVDDTPENIDVLNGILVSDYRVKVALNGEKALQLIASSHPDLILLDVMMPGMDGFEVCRRIKSMETLNKVPVIFVTAKDQAADEARGFELGAVDYITEPINPHIVKARVKTHLELRSSQQRLEQLLSRTLLGSVKVMTNMLSFLAPETFNRVSRLRNYVKEITQHLKISEPWRFELAATLSHLGCLTIPPEIMSKAATRAPLTSKEKNIFETHPEVGANLLANIPGLEIVAEIIRLQLTVPKTLPKDSPNQWDPTTLGILLLKTVQEFDYLILSGESWKTALTELRKRSAEFSPDLVAALGETQTGRTDFVQRSLNVSGLRSGMILCEDLIDQNNLKIAARQTELTHETIQLILRFHQNCSVQEPIPVLVSQDLEI